MDLRITGDLDRAAAPVEPPTMQDPSRRVLDRRERGIGETAVLRVRLNAAPIPRAGDGELTIVANLKQSSACSARVPHAMVGCRSWTRSRQLPSTTPLRVAGSVE